MQKFLFEKKLMKSVITSITCRTGYIIDTRDRRDTPSFSTSDKAHQFFILLSYGFESHTIKSKTIPSDINLNRRILFFNNQNLD